MRPARQALHVALLLILALGCSDSNEPNDGKEGGRCYPNSTCNPGLTCLSGRCVKEPDGAVPDTRATSGDGHKNKDQANKDQANKDPCKKSPLWSGTATGVANFTYDYRPGCASKVYLTTGVLLGKIFSHYVSPNGLGTTPNITLSAADIYSAPSGKEIPLFTPGVLVQPVVVGVTPGTLGHSTCNNADYGGQQGSPPNNGQIAFTYSGTTPGNSLSIKIKGYLYCTGSKKWVQFNYVAKGVLQ